MTRTELLMSAWSFAKLHRLVVLIGAVIVLGSVLSLVIILRGYHVEPTFIPVHRGPPKVTIEEGLPARTLKKWGADPFRDVIREMELAEQKRREEAERKAREEADRKAKIEADRIAREEAERIAREEAEKKVAEERERQKKLKEERERRKSIVLSIRVAGIIHSPRGESSAIIEGQSLGPGDRVVKNGIEVIIDSIEANGVNFRDPETGEIYRVPLSR